MVFRFSYLALALSFATLNSCQIHTPSIYKQSTTGSLHFQLAFPETSNPFKLQAIPQSTNKFTLEIEGEGLLNPIIQTLTKTDEQAFQNTTISSIPVGSKRVVVKAYENETLLASGSNTVTVQANLSSQVEIELLPTAEGSIQLKIEGNVPLPLNLNLILEGEGLSTSYKESITLSAGKNPVTDLKAVLPQGKKTVTIRLDPSILGDPTLNIPALTQTFEINEQGSGEIIINTDQLIEQYGLLLSNLNTQELNGFDLVALIQQLLASGKLQETLSKLPLSILEQLKSNPATALLVSNALAAQPPTNGSNGQISLGEQTPTPKASIAPEKGKFIADIRLAITSPTKPVQLMQSSPIYQPRTIIPLYEILPNLVLQTNIWGVLVRTNQTSTQAVRYTLQLKKEDGKTITPLLRGLLNQRISIKGEEYQSGFIPFIDKDTLLNLEADNRYLLNIELRHPSGELTRESYTITLPAVASSTT